MADVNRAEAIFLRSGTSLRYPMRPLRRLSLLFLLILSASAKDASAPAGSGAPNTAGAPDALRRRASDGDAEAQRRLGFLLLEQGHRHPAEALQWLKLASGQNDMAAQGRLAHLLFWGDEGVPRNREAAVLLAKTAADADSAFAQDVMGSAYARGIVVKREPKVAFHYAALAFAQGMLNSGHNCAIAYLTGQGVERNEAEGVRLLRYAAEHGHPVSRFNLGTLVFNGANGVRRDTGEALRLLKLAAPDEPSACFYLGQIYRGGLGGVSKNPVEAVRWYEQGARARHLGCVEMLACAHWCGDGVPRDFTKSLQLFREAANLGSKDAQFTLGTIHWKGEGGSPDKVEALARWMVAAKLGHGEAARAVDKIMTTSPQLGTFAKARAERMEKEIAPPREE